MNRKGLVYKLFAGELVFEIVLALILLAGGLYEYRSSSTSPSYDSSIAGSKLGLNFSAAFVLFVRAYFRNRQAVHEDNMHAIIGVLITLHSILKNRTEESEKSSVRMCVVVRTDDQDIIKQLTNYVGDCEPHGVDRLQHRRAGVVGQAFRSGKAAYDRLPKDTNVLDFLVSTHGFDRTEAVEMKQDRRSWAAIPIGSPNPIAVLFVDSNTANFFGNKGCTQRRILDSSTIGIARYVER